MTDKEMSEDDLSHAWRTLSGEDKSPFLHLARRNLVAIKMPSSFSQRLSSEKGSDKGSAHNEFDGNNGSNNQEINADGTNAVGSTNKQVTMASHIEADAGASTVAWNIPDAQTDDANAPTPTRRRSPSFTTHIVHEGFLWKKGQRRHNWKRRYFVLAASDAIVTSKSSFDLFYYDMKTAIQRKLLGSVAVTGSQVLNVAFSAGSVRDVRRKHRLALKVGPRTLNMSAESEKEKVEWMRVLSTYSGNDDTISKESDVGKSFPKPPNGPPPPSPPMTPVETDKNAESNTQVYQSESGASSACEDADGAKDDEGRAEGAVLGLISWLKFQSSPKASRSCIRAERVIIS